MVQRSAYNSWVESKRLSVAGSSIRHNGFMTQSDLGAHPDILSHWSATTLPLAFDDHVVRPHATLVHRNQLASNRPAVLYLHGFVDYFFQEHLALAWEQRGWDFYALDLRDYGRSIQEGRDPNWIDDLSTYDEEIGAALRSIREGFTSANRAVVLMGHSTGGLIAAQYAHRFPGVLNAVVLNSPWLDLNSHWFDRVISTRLVDSFAPLAPGFVVTALDPGYGRWLHADSGGEWEYDLRLKPHEGFPVQASWLRAVRRAHAVVAAGLDIEVPVLVATSSTSGSRTNPSPQELETTDVVLNVKQMANRARLLGREVGVLRVRGGVHDLALSRSDARRRFFDGMFNWLDWKLPGIRT